ncbi:MAG: hypothetical protein WC876_01310 [Candidatus Thermoplasmatota archaeon]|jgi:hypothetical protein
MIPAIVILILGAIALGLNFKSTGTEDCPGHWHAAFAIFVNDARLNYSEPEQHPVAYGAAGHDHHLHGDDGIYHFHPPVERCIPVRAMLERLDVGIDGDSLLVGSTHGPLAGTYNATADATLQIWHQPYGGAWEIAAWPKIKELQLGDGDRILFTYGDQNPATLEAQKNSMKDLGTYDPGDV